MSSAIHASALPPDALLCKYLHGGAYADCYVTEVTGHVTHAEYVEAFYTSALFKVERRLLAWLLAKSSTDMQARQLACGAADSFAAWRVEGRSTDQLLLCDFKGRTRSWLMTAAAQRNGTASTRLYFGSAVVPAANTKPGPPDLGFVFRSLLGFHKVYSQALLRAARRRLAGRTAVANV